MQLQITIDADKKFNKGKYKQALALYLQAADSEDTRATAYAGIAQCQYKLRRYDDALSSSQIALELDQNNAKANAIQSYIFARRKNISSSEFYIREAIRKDTAFGEAFAFLGGLLLAQGKIDEANDVLGNALLLADKYWLTHYNVGLACLSTAKQKDALRHFIKAFLLKPTLSALDYILNLAVIKYRIGIIIIGSIFVLFAYLSGSWVALLPFFIYVLYFCVRAGIKRHWFQLLLLIGLSIVVFGFFILFKYLHLTI